MSGILVQIPFGGGRESYSDINVSGLLACQHRCKDKVSCRHKCCNASMARVDETRRKVFETAELLEIILKCLPGKELLHTH